jgi:hypothetical protein
MSKYNLHKCSAPWSLLLMYYLFTRSVHLFTAIFLDLVHLHRFYARTQHVLEIGSIYVLRGEDIGKISTPLAPRVGLLPLSCPFP